MYNNSYTLHLLRSFWEWLSSGFANSRFGKFISSEKLEKSIENSFIGRVFNPPAKKRNIKVIKNSVLLNLVSNYKLFLYALVFLAPLVPTMICFALAFLLLASYVLDRIINDKKIISLGATGILILLFIILTFVQSIFALALKDSLKIFVLTGVFMSVYFAFTNGEFTKKEIAGLFIAFALSGTVVSLYGVYQRFFAQNVSDEWTDATMFGALGKRIYSTLENPNVLGEYLLLAIPITFSLVWILKNKYAKLLFLACTGIQAICILFTGSRGCWLALLFGMFIYALFVDRRLLWLGIIGLALAPFLLPQSIINRFMSIGDIKDSSTSYRVAIWLSTIAMLKDFWHTGLGYGIANFGRMIPFYMYSKIKMIEHSHNLYLQILCEIGIVGLIAFLSILVAFFAKSISAYNKSEKAFKVLIVAVVSGCLAFLLQGMFDYSFYNYRVLLLFWVTISLGIVAVRGEAK
ncbi:O-antigen ligase family protein [Treponema sp. R6D11]